MKCEKCNKEVKKGKFCPDCGGQLISTKKKFKLSVITIISLIVLILVCIPIIGAMIYSVMDGSEAAGWLFLIAGMIGVVAIGYYSMVFVGSLICDYVVRRNNIIQTIIVIFLMLLPGLWLLNVFIESDIDAKTKKYSYRDMSFEFPKDMKRGGTSKDFDDHYSLLQFTKDECSITIAVYSYRDELSLLGNFKEFSDRFTIIKNDPNTIYEDFDMSYKLIDKNINGKTWKLYEKNYTGMDYKLYGIKIKDKFYKLEVKDKGNYCGDLPDEFMSTIKYK